MPKYKLGSLFAGIGGIDLGFKQAGFLPVWANDIDQYCGITFRANHSEIDLIIEDIKNITSKDIPDVDVLGGGFPCQPFSVAGHRKGFEDDRGTLFFHIIRILEEMKTEKRLPKVIFLENVKNMLTHNSGRTFEHMENELKRLGYFVTKNIINTCEYGDIPQNRERLFIIGFKDKKSYDKYKWPDKITLTTKITDLIDYKSLVDKKFFYTDKNKCYQMLLDNVNNIDSIYQYRRVYVRENKSGVCPTLTANMGMGGHNVPIIKDCNGNIRKLTPKECLLLQGFPKDFVIPADIADSKIYKQAGNSVSVPVIKRLAKSILEALEV